MAILKPFKAYRPTPALVQKVAALPYDVMTSAEACEMVRENPYSFLHVDKAEVDLPKGTDLYSDSVYKKACDNLNAFIEQGVYIEESKADLYLYRQTMNGRSQTGIVGCTSIDDYINNVIKKHEFTRADKEADRIRHVDACNANTGPIFLTYRDQCDISEIIADWKNNHSPIYDFTSDDAIGHTVWVIDSDEVIEKLTGAFSSIDYLYIADGHHRAASAVHVGKQRRIDNPNYTGTEEYNYFLSVLFPDTELQIMDYNRVLRDLNHLSESEFINKLSDAFTVEQCSGQYRPNTRHTFGLYMSNKWYKLTLKDGKCDETSPVERLDVTILQSFVLEPILGIADPRTDKRIDFVGGIRGLDELERRASTDMAAAFAMCPTTLDDLMSIADVGMVMPPKSTWFEPKLRSGIFIHRLS